MKKKLLAITLTAMMVVPALAATANACSRGSDIPTNYVLQHKGSPTCAVTAWQEYRCTYCGRLSASYLGLKEYHIH